MGTISDYPASSHDENELHLYLIAGRQSSYDSTISWTVIVYLQRRASVSCSSCMRLPRVSTDEAQSRRIICLKGKRERSISMSNAFELYLRSAKCTRVPGRPGKLLNLGSPQLSILAPRTRFTDIGTVISQFSTAKGHFHACSFPACCEMTNDDCVPNLPYAMASLA